ncbi:MAG: hypothetical protein HAW58_00300 [Candidatus Thioglobus sp.]|nr:hypothetical protein [Candidatus Thioglobus sp.]
MLSNPSTDIQKAANIASITANKGSIAIDTVQGNLYIKRTDGVASEDIPGWFVIPNASGVFLQGGNIFGDTARLGSNNAQSLELETNNTVALTLDTSQNASFVGNITLNNKNISGVNELKINTLKPQTDTLDFVLNPNQTDALRITDGTTEFLNFNTEGGTITVGAALELGTNEISGSNFAISGGTIDNVVIDNVTSLNVGDLQLISNSITSTHADGISFGDENLTTSGNLTVGGLNVSGSNIDNLGDLSLSSLSPVSTGTIAINLNNTQAKALVIKQGDKEYLTFDTSTGAEKITVGQNLVLGDKNISGSDFTITGGTINNTIIGATSPAAAKFTSLGFDTLTAPADLGSQTLTHVNIDSGTIDGVTIGSDTALISLKVGMFSISGNSINVSGDTIDFGDNHLQTSGTLTVRTLDISKTSIASIGSIALNSLSAHGDTIDINLKNNQAEALKITQGTDTFLTFDTENEKIILGQTLNFNNKTLENIALTSGTINGVSIGTGTATGSATTARFTDLAFTTLTAPADLSNHALNNVNIDSGTLDNVYITANSLTIGSISINDNQITSGHADGISFADENLTTSGAITSGSLSAPTISGVDEITLDNIFANSSGSIAIGVDGNAINLAADALKIEGGNVTTKANLTVGGTFNAGTVTITGGNIDGVAIGADVAASSLKVGMFSIGGNSIISSNGTIDFGAATLTTTGNLVVGGQDFNNENVANINNISLNQILARTSGNISIGAAGNTINLATDALQIAADKNITLSNNLTVNAGNLNANAVAITGGDISNVAITATTLTVDDITIDNGNQITSSHANGISFDDEALTTTGLITAGSLTVPTITGGSISLSSISANSGSIAIGIANDSINIAGTALTVNSGNVSTARDLTVTGTFNAGTVDINGGNIDGVAIGADVAATSLKVGMFSIGGNSIISSTNVIDFGGATLTTTGNLVVGGQDFNSENVTGINDISLNQILARTGNISIGAAGNTINLATDALQIAADKNITLSNNLTVNAGTLTANAVAITGGAISGVTVAATTLTVDNITIDGNTITSSTGGISFADENLTTSGAINANSLTAPTISGVDEITLDNILAKTDNSIAIGVDGNAINLAADALKIEGGNVTTKANLTVGGTFNAGTVTITGGTIDNVEINATRLAVDNILIDGNSITAVSGGNIDFGAATLTTTGSISANGFDANEQNISNVGEISLDSIAADQNIAINAIGEVNIQSGKLVINATNVTVNNTLDINTTELTKITFGGSPTGVIAINNDNQYALMNASDRRVKQNIQNTRHNASNILNAFRVVDFRYIAHPTSNLITGFIAQEAREIYPAMVSELKKDLLGISSSTLIPILVKGFQEQQTDINSLTAAIEVNQNDINLNKNLKINNKILADEQNNLYANSLKLESNIELENDEFSIKRSDTMSDLMSLSADKISNVDVEGYLSVKDVYLADGKRWASNTSQFNVFVTEPNVSDCIFAEHAGSIGILANTEKLYICSGVKGWQILEMKDI